MSGIVSLFWNIAGGYKTKRDANKGVVMSMLLLSGKKRKIITQIVLYTSLHIYLFYGPSYN